MNHRQKYQIFISSRQPYLFQQIAWLDLAYGAENWEVVFLEKKGQVIDALPYGVEKKMGFSLIRPALLTPYLANIDRENGAQLLELFHQLPDSSECVIAVPPIPELATHFSQAPTLLWKKRPTYLLDLRPSATPIYDRFTKERKRHIKKATAHLTIKEHHFDVPLFVQWHQQSFERKNTKYPYTTDFIEQVIHTAQLHQSVVCKQALHEGKVVAQIACFYDSHTMYYLLGAYDPAYTTYNGMSLLMYQCILHAQTIGLQTFDFEGSSDPGIASFFAKFGAEETSYYILSKPPSTLWKLKKALLK